MSDQNSSPRVIFGEPDIPALRKEGLAGVDMHFHTNHSDSPTRVRDALALAQQKGIGLAITDHNAVSGVIEAERSGTPVLLIPGIEISAWDGPHILLYFYSAGDLAECYERHIRETKSRSPCLATSLTTPDIAAIADDYNCVMVAAHPFGYLLFNKGLCKCIDHHYLPPRIYSAFDGLEVISGGMSRALNGKAADVAERRGMCCTGGTDGHILSDLGHVLTCAPAETTEEFLEAVIHRTNCVCGREKNILEKGVMASAMLPQYLPYTVPSLVVHYHQNIPRVRHFLDQHQQKAKKK